MESRLSVMERTKREDSRRGEGGGGGGLTRTHTGGARSGEFIVRLRGLPWECTKDDIADFLHKCRIEGGHRGIIINEDDRGRAAGDAYVELESAEDLEDALRMHKRDMGSRYIEVFEASAYDMDRARDMGGRWGGTRSGDRGYGGGGSYGGSYG